MEKWNDILLNKPKKEGYYRVKYKDGSEDEKPFRIRPKKNIYGFMTELQVTHWK